MIDEILLETEDKMQKAIDVMENRFLNELKAMDVEVECIYQAKEYQSGRY